MKRPAKRNSAKPSKASPGETWKSWPGLFFKQRADCSFEWISPEMGPYVGVVRKTLKPNPKVFWARLHPGDLKAVGAQIESCARSGEPITHVYRVISASTGKIAHISESRRPILDRNGKICGYECQWTDLTCQMLM